MTDEKESTATSKDNKGAVSEVDASFDEVADELASLKVCDHDDAPPAGSESQTDSTEANDDSALWKPLPLPEDCPVCFVPLPRDHSQSFYFSCCGRLICTACDAENKRALTKTNKERDEKELPLMDASCAFCRMTVLESDTDWMECMMKRIDKDDSFAMLHLANMYLTGENNLPKNEAKAVELLQRAADVGSAEAMGMLGVLLVYGKAGLAPDEERGKKLIYDALKRGDVCSRHNVGLVCGDNDYHAVAMEHLKLSAAAGFAPSMEVLWNYFTLGHLSKAELEESLRAHQNACEEMSSEERRRVTAYEEAKAGNDKLLELIYEAYYSGYMSSKQLKETLGMHGAGNKDKIRRFLTTICKKK